MNETIQTIKRRFSCRKFSDKAVSDELLQAIVDCAKYAPNNLNRQDWAFSIIRTPEGLSMLREAAGKTPPSDLPTGADSTSAGAPKTLKSWPHQGDFCGAPAVILVCGKENAPAHDVSPALAAENLMLAATSLGLATLWSTVFAKDIFRDEETAALKSKLIPEGYVQKAAIFVGYPEEIPAERPPRRPCAQLWL